MSIIERMCKQDAVWWARQRDTNGALVNSEDGRPMWELPVQIKCRWDDEIREFIGRHGTLEHSMSVVYVDRDMSLGDCLMLGTLADLEDSNDSNSTNDTNDSSVEVVSGALEILGWAKNPNIRATKFLRTAFLGPVRAPM